MPCRGVPARMLTFRSVRAGGHALDPTAGEHEQASSVEDFQNEVRCNI
jgi:hypothetical protein